MDNKAVKVTSLSIKSMPGIGDGMAAELFDKLGGNIVLVYGPNASGKSSAIRALKQLLWQSKDKDSDISVKFNLNGDSWEVYRNKGRQEIFKNGVKTAESLPGSEFAERYNLSISNLFLDAEDQLAQKVQNEIYGGLKPESIVKDREYSTNVKPARGIVFENLTTAETELATVKQYQNSLKTKELDLVLLQDKIEDFQRKESLVRAIEKALEYKLKSKEVDSLSTQFQGYNPLLRKLENFSFFALQGKEEDKQELEKELQHLESQMTTLNTEIEELNMDFRDLNETELRTLEELKDSILNHYRIIDDLKSDAKEAYARLKIISQKFGYQEDVKIEDWNKYRLLQAFSFAEAGELYTLIDQYRAHNIDFLQISASEKGLLARLQESELNATENDLLQAITALSDWLKNRKSRNFISPVFFIGYSLILAIALAVFHKHINSGNAYWISGVIVILTLILYYISKTSTSDGKSAVEQYNKTAFANIADWNIDSVSKELDNLISIKEKQGANKEVEIQLNALQSKKAELSTTIDNQKRSLESYKANINAQLDLSPESVKSRVLELYLEKIIEWQEVNTSFITARENLRHQKNILDEKTDAFNRIIAKVNYDPCDSLECVRASYSELSRQYALSKDKYRELSRHKQESEIKQAQLQELQQKIIELFATIGLTESDRAMIFNVSKQLDEYKAAKDELDKQNRILASLEESYNKIAAEIQVQERLLEMSEEQLEELLDNSRSAGRELYDLNSQKGGIKQEIKSTMTKDDLEKAIHKRDEALEGLKDMYIDNLSKITGFLIIDKLKSINKQKQQPEILRRANDILKKITKGVYEIRISENTEKPLFMGHDLERNRSFPVEELSSGTRIHLLMALRLASIEQQESTGMNWMMPLFADELLANSDSERAEAIIETLIEISKTGRQIFYLTPQVEEVEKWQEHLQKHKEISSDIVKLDKDSINK